MHARRGIGPRADGGGQGRPADGLPRWFNLLAAGLGLSFLAPLLGLVSLVIRLESAGPVLFRQLRVGREGRFFVCYKFRSMRQGADANTVTIDAIDAFRFNPPGAARNPRLTLLGAAIRRTSVDELPQLLNVVRGDMALVGPRPEIPAIAVQFPARYQRRQCVLPGITGLAQVRGRADLTYGEMIAYDLSYIKHRCPGLDLRILLATLTAVWRGAGAR